MKSRIRKLKRILIPRFLYVLYKGLRLTYSKKSYLVSSGLINTYRTGIPCRTDGSPVPWMNYNVIKFLEGRVNKSLSLFEFGSGYSTTFYANLAKTVTSLEYDDQWLQLVRSMVPDNVEIIFKHADVDGDYCRAILESRKKFDVVIVDGKDRNNCIMQTCQAISGKGVVVLDDSHRDRYQAAFRFLKEKEFRHIDFEGLKPRGIANYRTTVFYRDNNCLGIWSSRVNFGR